MFIKCTHEGTQSLKRPWMDEPVRFASTGTAQVAQDVGERLVDEIDAIQRHESADKDTNTEIIK